MSRDFLDLTRDRQTDAATVSEVSHTEVCEPINYNKKLSYCWETVRRESMPRIAEMDMEMTT